MAHPSRSHNSQSVSENSFPLPEVDQVLEVYDRQPDISPDVMDRAQLFFFFFFGGGQICSAKKVFTPIIRSGWAKMRSSGKSSSQLLLDCSSSSR